MAILEKGYLDSKMDIKDKIKGAYYGWFFGPGAILRKDLAWNYWKIKKDKKFSKTKKFEEIPTDHKMYDQLTQTLIVHEIITKHRKISPELFRDKLLELNKKDDVLNNDQYGPSTQKAIKAILAGKNVRETGKEGLTTGAAMRCLPIGLFFRNDLNKLIKNTYESCIISHNTDVAVSSALSVNIMIYYLLKGENQKKALELTLKKLNEEYGKYGNPTAFAKISERISYAVRSVKGKKFDEATKIIAEKIGFSWYAIEQIPAAFAVYFSTKNAKEAELMCFKLGYGHTAPQIACAFHGAEKGYKIFPIEIIRKIEAENNFDIDKLVTEIL